MLFVNIIFCHIMVWLSTNVRNSVLSVCYSI